MLIEPDSVYVAMKCTRYDSYTCIGWLIRSRYDSYIQLLKEERLQGATLLVLANKQDLDGAATHDEIRKLLNLGNYDSYNYMYDVIYL